MVHSRMWFGLTLMWSVCISVFAGTDVDWSGQVVADVAAGETKGLAALAQRGVTRVRIVQGTGDAAATRAAAESAGLAVLEGGDGQAPLRDARWSVAYENVLKGRAPAGSLESFLTGTDPRGILMRGSPHWDETPLALILSLGTVPVFSPGQALAACSRDVLPRFAGLRKQDDRLRAGDLVWLTHDQPTNVVAFLRADEKGHALLCVFNLGKSACTVTLTQAGRPAATPLAGKNQTLAAVPGKLTYAFSGLGYDVRELLDARPPSVEYAARQRACAAARLPASRDLPLKESDYRPDGKTWNFAALAARPSPPGLKGRTMYQIFLRMFTPEGTFKAAEARLPFVRSLGTDIIYLASVAKADRGTDRRYWSGRQKASGLNNPCNPYRIADFFAIDPEYGTEQDAKDFVAAVHALGMKVLFDVVYYHCGPNAVFLKEHPEWVLRKPDGSFDLGKWAFPRFDVKNPEVREYLFENMKWYLTTFDADGFRCDVGEMLPLWCREEANRRNKRVKPDVLMMDEGHDPRDQQVAFDLDYCYRMQWAIRDMLRGVGSATNLVCALVDRGTAHYPRGYRWMRCFQNHDFANCGPDQKRYETLYGTDLNDAMIATLYTLDGVPMLYNGQEIADTAPHSIWSDRNHGKWGIDWSNAVTPVGAHRLALVKKLAALRHAHPDFFDAPTEFISTSEPDAVYAYRRPLADGSTWITAVNISSRACVVTLPAGYAARLAGPGATLDMCSGRLALPAKSWIVAANGPTPLVRVPHAGKGPEGHFHPTYESTHDTTAASRPVPDCLRTGVMYQLFTRMFTPEGTFAAARKRLPTLKDLGVNIIYLTPHQLADDDADTKHWSSRQKRCGLGNPKNPYRQKDFFAVDPEYGTKEDLRAFVAEAHRLGMKEMFDLVYFHCGPRAVFLSEHPDFIVRNPDGTPRLGDWAFPEMDIANPAVRAYLYENMTGFVRDYDVDGFRCDVADMLPVDFWEEGARRCRALKRDFFLLCEGLKGDDQIAAFDLSYGFYTQWTLVDLLQGRCDASLLETAWRAQQRDYPKGFHWMRCFENHDFANVNPGEKRKEELYGPKRNAAMIATCFLMDGVPMLYNGQEIADAAPHSIWSNRDHGGWHIDWTRADDVVARERRALVKRLSALRHQHPALFDAPLEWLDTGVPEKSFAFRRVLPEGTITLAVNVTDEPVEIVLNGTRCRLEPQGFLLAD